MPKPCESCRRPLRAGAKRWHQECLPSEFKRQNLARANRIAVLRRQRLRFGAEVDRIVRGGKVTREDLIEFGATCRAEGWRAGYSAADLKWRRRAKEAA